MPRLVTLLNLCPKGLSNFMNWVIILFPEIVLWAFVYVFVLSKAALSLMQTL